MICRKCGSEIPDNSIRCSNCGIRVNMYCPSCHTLNTFGVQYCVNCDTELITYCSVCGSANIYSLSECRKCHSKLIKNSKPKNQKDAQVVESFVADETAYRTNNDSVPIKITDDTENNGLPVIEKVNTSYSEINPDKIFNVDDEVPELNETNSQHIEVDDDTSIDNLDDVIDEDLLNEDTIDSLGVEENIETESSEKNAKSTDELSQNAFLKDVFVKPDTVKKIVNVVKNSLQKHIIEINGEDDNLKSNVLQSVSRILYHKGYLSLYGNCTQLVRITSFGFFQDVFLRLMGFPSYTANKTTFIEDFKKSNFAKVFSFLNHDELNIFWNILYPNQKDVFDNIMTNKSKVYSILERIIKSFLINNNLVILIDNFESLDIASFDFIVHMLKNGYFNNRLKLIATNKSNRDIKDYFELSISEEKMFQTIEVEKLNRQELLQSIEKTFFLRLEEVIDKDTIDIMIEKSNNKSVILEQETALLFDSGYIQIKDGNLTINRENIPSFEYASLKELIRQRINYLKPISKNILFMAAMVGFRVSKDILCLSVTIPEEKAQEILNELVSSLFLYKTDNYTYEFTSLTLWKFIYEEAEDDLLYKDNAKRLYYTLNPLVLSNSLQILMSCKNVINTNDEFLIWKSVSGYAAKLGDTSLYVFTLKQCLSLIDKQDIVNSEDNKQRIYEELGKLLYQVSPQEAVLNLSNVLDLSIKMSDLCKTLDISGYFVKSCYLTGNYFGVIEAVDSLLSIAREKSLSGLEIALIKTRKLNALVNLGNSEEVINLIKEEIFPELNQILLSNQFEQEYKDIILNTVLNTKVALAKAYVLQGNSGVLTVLDELRTLIERYDYNTSHYKLYVDIIEALHKSICGNINESNEILNNISFAYKNRVMEPELLALWNLVNITNRILLNKYEHLIEDLFELTVFANNINDYFVKNISKLILGYVRYKEGKQDIADEIYQEQTIYFAKEKNTIGALLSWSLIVQKNLSVGEINESLDISTKALEIAQTPKVNNYFFMIQFQKLLAEIYLIKKDFTAVKMYLEQAIEIAKQLGLRYQLIKLYIAYAHYIQEVMKDKKIYSLENLNIVHDMYKNAIAIAKELVLQNMIELASREYSSFKTFCQLNSIDKSVL